ncbi:hypothetical protein [Virgibacillus halodenitrificans]|uniref:hypothetical protein n=1 Tax=Virgibacillus halodenitrificans TaxID=1482 RepID=UPI000EF49F75|nr:hypothetical protein [Virgibacillus halodenitrificans]
MELNPDEQYSYMYSMSNLATIKTFHDAGVNVHTFSAYMVDINYSMSNGDDIFNDGCKQLFPFLKVYSDFEDEKYLNKLKKEQILSWVPEKLYVFTNEPLRRLYESSYASELEKCVIKSNTITQDSMYDGEIIPFPSGFGIALFTEGQYHELAQAVVHIYKESNRLFQLLKDERK